MNKNLGLLLLTTALLAAWATWWPQSAPMEKLVQAVQRNEATVGDLERSEPFGRSPNRDADTASRPLPKELPDANVLAARRNPFAPYAPTPPPAPRAPHVPPPPSPILGLPMVAQAPPPHVAPAVAFRYLGRFVAPTGHVTIYLEGPGATALPVTLGARLEGGFVVSALSDEAVELSYPAVDGFKVKISVPPRTGGVGE